MAGFMRKLRQTKGESLVETMVSLLICVLAISLLSTSITAAMQINQKNKEADQKYNEELKIAETFLDVEGYSKKEIQLRVSFQSATSQTVTVTRYGGDDGVFAAYDYEAEVEDDE